MLKFELFIFKVEKGEKNTRCVAVLVCRVIKESSEGLNTIKMKE